MSIKLDPNFKAHLNKESLRILNLISEKEEEVQSRQPTFGSIDNQITQDWTNYMVDSPRIMHDILNGKTISIEECYKGKCIGFTGEAYIEFIKFINMIDKNGEVSKTVNKEFVEKNSLEWFISNYKQQSMGLFSDFFTQKINSSIELFVFHFPIHNLEIFQPIIVGKVTFHYFTKEYFDHICNWYSHTYKDRENAYEILRQQYQGKVLVAIKCEGQKDKAKELAFEHCSLAVDILKVFSEVIDDPTLHIGFDIDRRTREIISAETIYYSASNSNVLNVDYDRIANYHVIGFTEWQKMNIRGISFLHEFLVNMQEKPSELEQLIIASITRYANALSLRNLHQRIVEIFTICESLLLRSENAPIIVSISKYAPILIFPKSDEIKDLLIRRKQVIKIFTELYQVRSAMIHHAVYKPFNLEDMRKLQLSLLGLLINLIRKTKTHATKKSILDEIDDATLNAY